MQFIGPASVHLLHKSISPDNQRAMCEVVERFVAVGSPVPVLIPAGMKLPPHDADFSELFALQVRVRKPPVGG